MLLGKNVVILMLYYVAPVGLEQMCSKGLILYRPYYWLISAVIGHAKIVPNAVASLKLQVLNFWA
jgi:hypothetical protein